jgi:hypothetical protein
VHAKYPEKILGKWSSFLIQSTLKPRLFSVDLTHAMIMLLQAGVDKHTSSGHKFLFVSESTLPCQPVDQFVATLTHDSRSIFSVDQYYNQGQPMMYQPFVEPYAWPLDTKLDRREYVRSFDNPAENMTVFKTGQWNALNRADALVVISEFPSWKRHVELEGVPPYILFDPQFMATLLVGQHRRDVRFGPLTYQRWEDSPTNHPNQLNDEKEHDFERAHFGGFLTSRKWSSVPKAFACICPNHGRTTCALNQNSQMNGKYTALIAVGSTIVFVLGVYGIYESQK